MAGAMQTSYFWVNQIEETMRKLKLQVQMTVDGFVAGPNGEMNWINVASLTALLKKAL